MQFLWPDFLWLLLAAPLLVLLYLWLLKRKKKLAVRFASLSIVKEAMGPGQSWRRHVPPALFLLALIAMLLAAARPTAVVTLPSQQQTIILAMDVSGSMRATDVQPSRLEAAQAAGEVRADLTLEQVLDMVIAIARIQGDAAYVEPILDAAFAGLRP